MNKQNLKNQNSFVMTPEEKLGFLRKSSMNSLLSFCQVYDKEYGVAFFHEIIAEKLEKVIENIKKNKKSRIILAIPPRHGKSQLASIYFPAWALGKDPTLKFIFSTYGADLAEKIGMKARDVVMSDKYKAIFPHTKLRQDTKAKANWLVYGTDDEGKPTGAQGQYYGVGVGSAVTGTGADVIILDDPHKDRAEAESETYREKVWEYYRSTLYSRLEGAGAVIIIMQRWHTDDLVGRLLDEDEKAREAGLPTQDWELVNFPAIADNDEYFNNDLVRKEGEALWPDQFPLETLENIKQTAGVYNFNSQYQQDPIVAENQEFKETMFQSYNERDIKSVYMKYVTLVDPAISQKKTADNTVILTVAKEVDGPNIYRIREDAGHFTPQQTVDLIFTHQAEYKSDVWMETVAYQKALKYSVEDEQKVRMRYFKINEVKNGNKEMRIRGLLPMYERGIIWHRKSDYEYEKELLQFPRGKHDDRIDCMSFMLEALEGSQRNKKASQFYPHRNWGKR